MKYPFKFWLAIVFAFGWALLRNDAACSAWSCAALVISCFRKGEV